jgi:cytochrome c biogenesis protein CcmG/thiol:disulfide interchange protein DsbE
MTEQETPETLETRSRNNISLLLWIVVGLGLVALLAFGFLSQGGSRPQPGEPAPGFSLTLFDGSEVSLNDLRGQVVVVNFWASWCSPCREEAPDLQSVWAQYEGKGVVFLGVTYKDAEAASLEFVETYGLTYANGFDARGRISRAYGVVAVPETFIIDRDGNVAWLHIGAVKADALSQQLERLQNWSTSPIPRLGWGPGLHCLVDQGIFVVKVLPSRSQMALIALRPDVAAGGRPPPGSTHCPTM